jgi:hypothetical protein
LSESSVVSRASMLKADTNALRTSEAIGLYANSAHGTASCAPNRSVRGASEDAEDLRCQAPQKRFGSSAVCRPAPAPWAPPSRAGRGSPQCEHRGEREQLEEYSGSRDARCRAGRVVRWSDFDDVEAAEADTREAA